MTSDSGGSNLRERLERIETAIAALTEAVGGMQVRLSTTASRLAMALSVAAILVSGFAGFNLYNRAEASATARSELCEYIKHKDNQARQDRITGTRLLFHGFKT